MYLPAGTKVGRHSRIGCRSREDSCDANKDWAFPAVRRGCAGRLLPWVAVRAVVHRQPDGRAGDHDGHLNAFPDYPQRSRETPADLLAHIQAGSPVSPATYGGSPIASFSTPSGNISCGVFGPSSAAVLCFIDRIRGHPFPRRYATTLGIGPIAPSRPPAVESGAEPVSASSPSPCPPRFSPTAARSPTGRSRAAASPCSSPARTSLPATASSSPGLFSTHTAQCSRHTGTSEGGEDAAIVAESALNSARPVG